MYALIGWNPCLNKESKHKHLKQPCVLLLFYSTNIWWFRNLCAFHNSFRNIPACLDKAIKLRKT